MNRREGTFQGGEVSPLKMLRFEDLYDLGLVRNRQTLWRWIKEGRFPPPVRLAPNSIAWKFDEVKSHLDRLAAERDSDEARHA